MNIADTTSDFVKTLASNETKLRAKATRELSQFLQTHESQLNELEFMRIWKGLFYCFWMSDKRPVQQQLARHLASCLDAFQDPRCSLLYFTTFWRTLVREWHGLDTLRLDKYYYLIRVMTLQAFQFLKAQAWDEKLCRYMNEKLMKQNLMDPEEICKVPRSLLNHFMEHWVETLKAACSEVDEKHVLPAASEYLVLMEPFLSWLKAVSEQKVLQKMLDCVIEPLLLDPEQKEIVGSFLSQHLIEASTSMEVPQTSQRRLQTFLMKHGLLIKPHEDVLVQTKTAKRRTKVTAGTPPSQKESLICTDCNCHETDNSVSVQENVTATVFKGNRKRKPVDRVYFQPPNFSIYSMEESEEGQEISNAEHPDKKQKTTDVKSVRFGKNQVALFYKKKPASTIVVDSVKPSGEQPIRIEMSIIDCAPPLESLIEECSSADGSSSDTDGHPRRLRASDFM